MNTHPQFDAVVLAGGRGRRLAEVTSGTEKAAVILGTERLVDRVVTAAHGMGASRVIAVGPDHVGALADLVVREDPPFTGPLPALAAGLDLVEHDWVMLLPCDLENPVALCAAILDGFSETGSEAHEPVDGVYLRDEEGRPQWLAGLYRVSALRQNITALAASELADRPLRVAFDGARLASVAAPAQTVLDIDTPTDLERARASLGQNPG